MRLAWMLCLLGLAGCGGDDDGGGGNAGGSCDAGVDPNAACGMLVDSACSSLVRCKAYIMAADPSAGVYTADFCQQVRGIAIQACSATICAASQADVDGCTSALGSQPCSEICGQVPSEPMVCERLGPRPNMNRVECAP
jgi:hypothetical protein